MDEAGSGVSGGPALGSGALRSDLSPPRLPPGVYPLALAPDPPCMGWEPAEHEWSPTPVPQGWRRWGPNGVKKSQGHRASERRAWTQVSGWPGLWSPRSQRDDVMSTLRTGVAGRCVAVKGTENAITCLPFKWEPRIPDLAANTLRRAHDASISGQTAATDPTDILSAPSCTVHGGYNGAFPVACTSLRLTRILLSGSKQNLEEGQAGVCSASSLHPRGPGRGRLLQKDRQSVSPRTATWGPPAPCVDNKPFLTAPGSRPPRPSPSPALLCTSQPPPPTTATGCPPGLPASSSALSSPTGRDTRREQPALRPLTLS